MKKKTNKLLFVLLIVILVFGLVSMVACQPPQEPDDGDETQNPTITDTAIVKNGHFSNASNSDKSNAYVKDSVTNWTPASGVTAYSSAKVGAIDLTQSVFEANKDAIYSNMAYPGIAPSSPKDKDGKYTDTNALVISSVNTAGSLYYKSPAITIAKGKHYKLSLEVYTDLIDAKDLHGVWIYVNTGAYAEFQAINTNKTWKTYNLFIEANNAADRTMYIQLWLGYGPKFIGASSSGVENPRMTKGVALFDNIIMNSITAETYASELNVNSADGRDVTVVSDTKNNNTAIISLKYPDTNFSYVSDFATTSSSSYKAYFSAKKGVPNTNNYTSQVGKDKIEDTSDFPTSSYGYSYSTVGIFDMSKLFAATYDEAKAFKEYVDTYKAINSSFVAPKIGANYRYDDFMDPATRQYRLAGRSDNPTDTTALMIYHPDYAVSGYGYKGKNTLLIEKDKYYTISVWVYLWVPEYGKTAVTEPTQPTDERMTEAPVKGENETEEEFKIRKNAYDANVAAWKTYDENKTKYDNYINDLNDYNDAKDRASATFKLTGATIEGGEMVQKSTEGQLGVWEQLTFKIKGNELSNRSVSLEFWYGEGNWGEDTLMAGGCFFDNISITASPTVANPADFETLSPLTPEDYTQFGLLDTVANDYNAFAKGDKTGDWQFSFEDSKTSDDAGDAGIIKGSAAQNPALWGSADTANFFAGYKMPSTFKVTLDNNEKLFNLVMLRNNIYTSSILKYIPKNDSDEDEYLKINPNAFYRFSAWVYTDGIDDNMGVTAALFRKDDTQLTSLTKINTKGEWTEVVFYLQGSSDEVAEFYIKFTLGSGNNFSPANLVKGAVYTTAFTYKTIAYSEYNGATTGTYTTKYTVPSSTTAKDSVSNGWFTNLDSSTYSGDKKDLFDTNGNLIGVGIPQSWTAKAAESALDKPTNVKVENNKTLTWTKGSDYDKFYLIYLDGVKVEDDKTNKTTTVNNYFVGQTTGTTWNIEENFAKSGATFKVRAVRNIDDNSSNILGYSDFSVPATYSGGDHNINSYNTNNIGLHIPKAGVIDYKHYEGNFAKDTSFYTENHDNPYSESNPNGELYYISPYDKLLMVSSEYYTRMGYVSPSTGSLTSNSYYMLSVWAKTVDGAKASITISNKSNVITANTGGENPKDGDYIGYVNQDTNGQWVQYVFYIKTTKMSSPAGLQLELYLGNKYAETLKIGTKSYIQGVSKGTVFFDDITYKKLADESEYNRLVYGAEDPDTLEEANKYKENEFAKLIDRVPGNMFSNNYVFKLIDLTTDSFDSFTEGTSPLGGTPGAYSHYNVANATEYSASADLPAMLYGVYDKRTAMDEIGEHVLDANSKSKALFLDEAELRAFLTQNVGTGNNYLLLANIIDNGQYYLTSDSFSLNSNAYYKISFWAKVKAPQGKKAEFRFEYGNETEKWSTVYIDSEEWTEYTFYIFNSDTNSVSSNKFAFYLGTNESKVEGENIQDMFAGLLIIDNVTFTPLSGEKEYNDAVNAYDALSEAEKAAANFSYYKFVKAETKPVEPETPDEEDPRKQVNSQLWLLVSSIVIGALLIAVVVVLTWRKVKKRIKRNIPVKVISNVPVNMQTKEQRKIKDNKKDINTDDFID